jgi:hypothetical protein
LRFGRENARFAGFLADSSLGMACKNDLYAYKHDYSACWDEVAAYKLPPTVYWNEVSAHELEGMVREPVGTVYKPLGAVCWNGVSVCELEGAARWNGASAPKIRVTVNKPEGVVCKLGGTVNKPGGAARWNEVAVPKNCPAVPNNEPVARGREVSVQHDPSIANRTDISDTAALHPNWILQKIDGNCGADAVLVCETESSGWTRSVRPVERVCYRGGVHRTNK